MTIQLSLVALRHVSGPGLTDLNGPRLETEGLLLRQRTTGVRVTCPRRAGRTASRPIAPTCAGSAGRGGLGRHQRVELAAHAHWTGFKIKGAAVMYHSFESALPNDLAAKNDVIDQEERPALRGSLVRRDLRA